MHPKGSNIWDTRQLTSIYKTLLGSSLTQFLERYQNLHDAEVIAMSVSNDRSQLELSLENLCIFDHQKNLWRETNTKANLLFSQLRGCQISGEWVEYGIASFELIDGDRFLIVSNVGGVIEGKYGQFSLSANFGTESEQWL